MSIAGIRKGYLFGQKIRDKSAGGRGGAERLADPASYNTLLSAPRLSLLPPARSCVSFSGCYCHILCFSHFFVFNWNAAIFLASKSPVRSSIFTSPVIHVTHHVSALDQLKHSCTINRRGSSFPTHWLEICSIS